MPVSLATLQLIHFALDLTGNALTGIEAHYSDSFPIDGKTVNVNVDVTKTDTATFEVAADFNTKQVLDLLIEAFINNEAKVSMSVPVKGGGYVDLTVDFKAV